MSKSASHGHTVSDQHHNAAQGDQQHEHESESESGDENEGDDYAPHRDPERLKPVYERFGTLDETATHFDVSTTTIRKHLKKHELYTPKSGAEDREFQISPYDLADMCPEEIGLPPIGER